MLVKIPLEKPSGGMPMVVLCGQNVAKKVVAWDRPSPTA